MIKLAVVGVPRSGTRYLAACFDAAGICAGHEATGVNETGLTFAPLELLRVDVSWLLVPHIHELRREGIKVAMLVRHPLNVIASMAARGFLDEKIRGDGRWPWTAYALHHVPELKVMRNALDRAAVFWLKWNRLALDSIGGPCIQVEDLCSGVLVYLAREAGFELAPERAKAALDRVPRTINSIGPPKPVAWTDLAQVVADEVLAMAYELGYSEEAPARP